jgi:hypothetical protein
LTTVTSHRHWSMTGRNCHSITASLPALFPLLTANTPASPPPDPISNLQATLNPQLNTMQFITLVLGIGVIASAAASPASKTLERLQEVYSPAMLDNSPTPRDVTSSIPRLDSVVNDHLPPIFLSPESDICLIREDRAAVLSGWGQLLHSIFADPERQ